MAKETIRTVCEGCMSGCGVLVHRENGRVTGITGDPEHPRTRGDFASRASPTKSWSITRTVSGIP